MSETISFHWPLMLWLLAVVPALALLYLRLHSRRTSSAGRFAGLAQAATHAGALRRHLPALLLLVGLCAMIVAVARPQAVITLPSRVDSIILAMDVSGSMRATDVKPNRLAAAQNAAKTFVEDQPGHVRIGVVSIAAAAAVVQSPTDNRKDIFQSIDRFQLQRGTALGSGIAIALATLVPEAAAQVKPFVSGRSRRARAPEPAAKAEPVAPGTNASAAIVLLSDGHSNTGPDPLEAAKLAAGFGVRVFTVGVGTPEGATLTTEGMSMRVRLDEETLKAIARTTDGEYFRAGNAGDLKRIYSRLSAKLTNENRRMTEVSALFAAAGAAFAVLAALLSLAWFNRIL